MSTTQAIKSEQDELTALQARILSALYLRHKRGKGAMTRNDLTNRTSPYRYTAEQLDAALQGLLASRFIEASLMSRIPGMPKVKAPVSPTKKGLRAIDDMGKGVLPIPIEDPYHAEAKNQAGCG